MDYGYYQMKKNFGEGHLYWENLDVDLSLEMIEHPKRFPLQSNI